VKIRQLHSFNNNNKTVFQIATFLSDEQDEFSHDDRTTTITIIIIINVTRKAAC